MVSEEEIKKLVIARIEAMPPELKVSLGNKELSKEELIKEVQKNTSLGRQIMQMHLTYLRAMKSGFS